MKNIFRAVALAGLFAGYSATACLAGTGILTSIQPSASTTITPGLYTVAQKLFAEGTTPVADISVASLASVQLVTITATSGVCRAVLSDADGQILRTGIVNEELEVDFYTMPTGTYHLAILDASGALQMKQTLVKR